MSPGTWGLPSCLLDEVSPFHLVLGPDLIIRQVGSSLRRVCPRVVPGRAFESVVEVISPRGLVTRDSLTSRPRSLFVLQLKEGDLARGNFVEPTVVEVPLDSWIWKRELFVPFVSVAPYDDLDEALRLANDTEYGLTAGFYSEDRAEIQRFLDTIEAGVLYVNRRAGATTGAWPGVQAFGGWKGSGSTGKAGLSMYYVAQFMREQSHTVVD